MLSMYLDSQRIMLIHFQKCGEDVNSSYSGFEMSFPENDQDLWGRGYIFIMMVQDQPKREFKNCNRNLNIHPTAQIWLLKTFIYLSH
jgi:hypothetical protein